MALTDDLATWGIDAHGSVLDLPSLFVAGESERSVTDVVVDIGCGMGESTRQQAVEDLSCGIIAIDVHSRGVAALLKGIAADQLGNVRVVHGDAVAFLLDRVAPRSLAGARIYFPDPWPKGRHHKRRLVQPEFVALLVDRLTPGGFIHCATDDADYAAQMLEVLTAERRLDNPYLADGDGFAPRDPVGSTARPITKYERRAHRMGHPVWDVWVTRTL